MTAPLQALMDGGASAVARGGGESKPHGPEQKPRNWIINALERNVESHPDWPVYRYLDADGNVTETITCKGALQAAHSVAAYLRQDCKLKPGDRVALVYPPGLEFVKAMWGCLFADIVAVPVPPPNPERLSSSLPSFNRILEDSGAVAILTDYKFEILIRQPSQAVDAMKRVVGRVTGWKANGWPDLPWYVTSGAANLRGRWWFSRRDKEEHPRLDVRRTDSFAPTDPPEDPDKVAYLQYTSGSTGDPKGVMVTHGNLYQHNEAGWDVFFRAEADHLRKQLGQAESVISGTHMLLWLPHFHDFCLTVGILGCGMKGHPLVLMSPLDFVKDPTRWMDCMARYKTTHTVGPDFSFGYVAKRSTPEQRRRWDLSNLQFIMSGAEPIKAHTMTTFFTTFAECGLKPSVFCSAYGLAEHVCGATAWGSSQLKVDRRMLEAGQKVGAAQVPGDARVLYSCGTPMKGVDLRIVHPDMVQPCEDGHVGEIWLSSLCITAGYYNRPQLNQEVFKACLAGEEGLTRKYLRTGDLGFMWQGELYVTGRLKDMLILRGRNIYPNDVEDCIRNTDHPWVRPGGLAAFPVEVAAPEDSEDADEEGLVVMVEVPKDTKPKPDDVKELVGFIRAQVMAHHTLACYAVVIASSGAIKKTTSGKVQRRACRAAFERGEYTEVSNPMILSCSVAPETGGLGANLTGRMSKQGSPVSSMRTSDSEQSSASIICMSECASDSSSEGGPDTYMGGSYVSSLTNSPSRSDPGADAISPNAANILSEQLMALPEDKQLETLLDYMVAQASEAANIEDLSPDQPLLELGLDSLRAAQFAVQIEEHLGLQVPFTAIFQYPTLRKLAAHILHLLRTPESAPISALQDVDTGVSLAALAEAAQMGALGEQSSSLLLSQAAKSAGVPCSPAQLYFLALEQTAPGGADQNVVGALRLRGALHWEALQGALQLVMERHDALRTHFAVAQDGSLEQVVQKPDEATVAFSYADAADLPPGTAQPHSSFSEALAQSLPLPVLAQLQAEAGTPFNLLQGPLVRALLVKLGSSDHLMLLTMHHAVCDGWSFKVMLDDVCAAYDALRIGKTPRLPMVRLQYPDFATWQARQLLSSSLLHQVEYWMEQLCGLPKLQLPTDFPRKAGHGCSRGGWLDIDVPEDVVRGVESFAAKSGATMYMVLLSSLQLLLAARSGQDDMVVASPFAGRVHPATRAMVGCCINTLPMRTSFQGLQTLGELVRDVRETALSAYQNSDACLETVMRALGRSPDDPLFSVEFNFLESEAQFGIEMDGLKVEPYEIGTGTATSDYYLVLGHAGRRVTGRLEYNAELFAHETARRMAAEWQAILEEYAKGDNAMLLSSITAQTGKQAPLNAADTTNEE